MSRRTSILVVDDEKDFRENVAEWLDAHGYEVLQAPDGETALACARERAFDLALIDILMPGMDGVELLGRLRDIDPGIEAVVVTGRGSIESAVEAMKRGAFHYITKPLRLGELEMLLRQAAEKARLARQNIRLREAERYRREGVTAEIVAESPAMREILEQAERLAATDASVLLEGETGTGKARLAEWMHSRSPRAEGPFVTVNAASLAESVVDAHLFGHERGAFAGAGEARAGMIETADGGTLFLHHVGDMPAAAQVRLLDFLERRVVRRVGSGPERAIDARVIAATNRDLGREVSQGRFREDLYHRFNVFRLRIPPLRDRREDLDPLAGRLLSSIPSHPRLGHAALEALTRFPWPGNVRELRHALERAVFAAARTGASEIRPEHLDLEAPATDDDGLVSVPEATRRHVLAVLHRMGGSRHRAAEILGMSERHLYRLLRRYQAAAK